MSVITAWIAAVPPDVCEMPRRWPFFHRGARLGASVRREEEEEKHHLTVTAYGSKHSRLVRTNREKCGDGWLLRLPGGGNRRLLSQQIAPPGLVIKLL